MHVGSSSSTRDQTQDPCIGSAESYPLDHLGSPQNNALKSRYNPWVEQIPNTNRPLDKVLSSIKTEVSVKSDKSSCEITVFEDLIY